jgi:hypothetical protein
MGDETSHGGSSTSNTVAEIDMSTSLCQDVSGFTVGTNYTLYFDLSRRIGTDPDWQSPGTVGVKICVGTTCNNYTRNNTTWGLTTSSLSFNASASTLTISITPISSYWSGCSIPCRSTLGMNIDDVMFNVPLAVTLLNFTTVKNRSGVDIAWQTAAEVNNDRFIVEKSRDGVDFIAVNTTGGAGTSQNLVSYQVRDPAPYTGTSYYRLKQVDYDGTVSYSQMAIVNFDGIGEFYVYPNPGSGIFTITALSGNTEITVVNMLGETIIAEISNSGSFQIDLSDQPQGVYYVRANNGHNLCIKRVGVFR